MKFRYLSLALLACGMLSSCSDDFLQDKKNYDSVNEDAYNHYSGASGRLDQIYAICLPDVNSSPYAYRNVSSGSADDFSKSTEEYSGFSLFVDPQAPLSSQSGNNPVPDFFYGTNKFDTSAYGRIRNVNDVIRGITNSTLSEEEKNELLGQAYFFRAWCYYQLVKWFGGVPLVKDVLEPTEESFTPRSTTKEAIEFICEDLDRSAEMLAPFTTNGGWSDSGKYGRVTTASALALKGRVLVLWASPLFNRGNDPDRWNKAYDVIKASIPVINSCGNYLAYDGNPGVNASNWARMFIDDANPELVFGTLYNNRNDDTSAADYTKNNGWEHGIRPSNALGGGGKVPSAMMVDLFPMSDGRKPASCGTYYKLDASATTYNEELPFLDRDPRFYRTFAFPGVRWAFSGDPTGEANHNRYKGDVYELWNYVWYTKTEDRDNIEGGNKYGPDGLMANAKGMYVRKRSDDLDVNGTPRYAFMSATGFKYSAAPLMEIRYAEVLLNYAEAACGAGHMVEAVEQLQKIRQRVGYTGDCGLQASLSGDQAACMSAILYERQIELAYEGKRFDDMRRWMLFDGGATAVAGAPSTWTLTGWGGNTCTWLGVAPLNGQRRENLEFRVKASHNNGLGGSEYAVNGADPDPLANVERCAAVDLRQPLDDQLQTLAQWYGDNIERNKKKGDSYDSNHAELYISYQPYYYFAGLTQGAQIANQGLPQNIGWADYNNGGALGTFDPLAE